MKAGSLFAIFFFVSVFAVSSAGSRLYGQESPFDMFLEKIVALKHGGNGRIMASGTMFMKEGRYSGTSDFVLETGPDGYHVVSGSNEIASDGSCNYIIDNDSREVTITFLDPSSRSVLSNPLAVLFDLPQGFKVKSQDWNGEGNDRCYVVELLPEGQETGLSFLKLRISSDGKLLTGLEFGISQSGSIQTHVDVIIAAFSFSGQDGGGFTPDLDTMERDGYFINDLR